jgi:hypothetical protein
MIINLSLKFPNYGMRSRFLNDLAEQIFTEATWISKGKSFKATKKNEEIEAEFEEQSIDSQSFVISIQCPFQSSQSNS